MVGDFFALAGFPHYFSLFVWCSTFGGFALLVVYLMMSVGALAGSLGPTEQGRGSSIAVDPGHPHHGGGHLGLLLQGADADDLGPGYALIWFVIGLVYMSW